MISDFQWNSFVFCVRRLTLSHNFHVSMAQFLRSTQHPVVGTICLLACVSTAKSLHFLNSLERLFLTFLNIYCSSGYFDMFIKALIELYVEWLKLFTPKICLHNNSSPESSQKFVQIFSWHSRNILNIFISDFLNQSMNPHVNPSQYCINTRRNSNS